MEMSNLELVDRIKQLEQENLELKKQQVDINKAKELYLKIFEDFPALIWRSRLDKLCDYFNRTWLEFTGRTMEQEFGNGWAEGVHPDDFQYCLDIYVTAFDKREAFCMEYRMLNKDGEYRWIRDHGRPFFDLDNSFIGYIGSCYDITENKEYEIKLAELNATKDKFFSIIAHDLRNPFQNLLGTIELLYRKVGSEDKNKTLEMVNRLQESATGTFELLVNLLEWAKSQSGTMPYKPEEIKVKTFIASNIEQTSQLAIAKNIRLHFTVNEDICTKADKNMLNTVLRNLITNAIKYTNIDGAVEVGATAVSGTVEIYVKDNGVGMDEETCNSLFKMGHNNSRPGTLHEKGTGLGLILCKEFVEKHGGQIWAESKEGEGSMFKFTLPVCK